MTKREEKLIKEFDGWFGSSFACRDDRVGFNSNYSYQSFLNFFLRYLKTLRPEKVEKVVVNYRKLFKIFDDRNKLTKTQRSYIWTQLKLTERDWLKIKIVK